MELLELFIRSQGLAVDGQKQFVCLVGTPLKEYKGEYRKVYEQLAALKVVLYLLTWLLFDVLEVLILKYTL